MQFGNCSEIRGRQYRKLLCNDMRHDVIKNVVNHVISPKANRSIMFLTNNLRNCCVVNCNSTLEMLSCLDF